MDWLKYIVNLIDMMDIPSKAVMFVLALIVFVAYVLFARESSTKVKLTVFFSIVGFGVLSLYILHHYSHETGNQQAQPIPRPQPEAFAAPVLLTLANPSQQTQVSQAQTGWIYCGKYDAARNQ